ncbi:MAG: hypothetical protein R3B70_34605 [Polyangiaceae bacterium]
MQERYGQLAKKIVRRALPAIGTLYIEHEIPLTDAQAADIYFIPEPGKDSERAPLGWLGRMTEDPCLLEMIQSTPGPRAVRVNVRKQLTLDHTRMLEATKAGQPEPPLVHLWMLCAGRPREVLDGYDYQPHGTWPPGFWTRARLDAIGLVVLSELPRTRDTLLLRLLGRGCALRDAITDLKALPDDAPERDIAFPPLVALRFEVTQDPTPDEEAREILMATQDLYEQWESRTLAKGRTEGQTEGRTEGLMAPLSGAYRKRFGAMPEPMRAALATKVTVDNILEWLELVQSVASPDDILRRLRNGKPAS